jgi:predicted O-methyltransferase YrrM
MMDTREKFGQLTAHSMAGTWENSIPAKQRHILEGCLGNSALNTKDLAVLYEWARQLKPGRVIEVGLATGSSTVCNLLAAGTSIKEYVIIDPYQESVYCNKGIMAARENAPASVHVTLLETFSYLALPKLLFEDFRFDFAFIDASHMFDATLVEFFYIDKMLADGGVIIMDDRPWPMVGAVVNFIKTNYPHYCLDCSHPRLTFLMKKHKDKRKWYDFRYFEIPRSERFESRIAQLQQEKGSAFTTNDQA